MHIEKDLANSKTDLTNNKILRTTEYIHENFTDQSLTVEKLANYTNISETYFRKLFLSNYGTTPLDYINKLRLNYAIELLSSGYYTVNEVSEKCGFSTPYYFSAFIKKQTNKSPIQFKKSSR